MAVAKRREIKKKYSPLREKSANKEYFKQYKLKQY